MDVYHPTSPVLSIVVMVKAGVLGEPGELEELEEELPPPPPPPPPHETRRVMPKIKLMNDLILIFTHKWLNISITP